MKRRINFLGLNISTGQPKPGPEKASDFIRSYFSILKLVGLIFIDQGNVDQAENAYKKVFSEKDISLFNWEHYKRAYLEVIRLLNSQNLLLNWGGDHSVAISTVGGFCNKYPDGFVLWIDAHADLNLPSFSPTGSVHGMPLSILLNLDGIAKSHFPWLKSYLSCNKLIYLGVRDIDPFERATIKDLNINYFSTEDIKNFGMHFVAEKILNLTKDNPLHISFDIDSVSPEFAKSTGVLAPEGITPDDLDILGQTLSKHKNIKSIDVVEINPLLGGQKNCHDTIVVAINFLQNLLSSNKSKLNYRGNYDDDAGGTNKEYDSAQVESGSQI